MTSATVDAYCSAVTDVPFEAVKRSTEQFGTGRVERNNSFPPSAAEFAENAREWQMAIAKRASHSGPEMHNGLIECDWGHGRVDLRGLTNAEQDRIIDGKGFVNGKNLAYLSLPEIRETITQGDLAGLETGKSFAPRLSRMP